MWNRIRRGRARFHLWRIGRLLGRACTRLDTVLSYHDTHGIPLDPKQLERVRARVTDLNRMIADVRSLRPKR